MYVQLNTYIYKFLNALSVIVAATTKTNTKSSTSIGKCQHFLLIAKQTK